MRAREFVPPHLVEELERRAAAAVDAALDGLRAQRPGLLASIGQEDLDFPTATIVDLSTGSLAVTMTYDRRWGTWFFSAREGHSVADDPSFPNFGMWRRGLVSKITEALLSSVAEVAVVLDKLGMLDVAPEMLGAYRVASVMRS